MVYRNQSRMYHTVEMPFGSGCRLTPPTVQTSPNNGLFFSFLIVFYSKKRQHTDRLQRINNIEETNPPPKKRESQSTFILQTFSPSSLRASFVALCVWRDGSGRVVMQDSESHDRQPRQRGHREPIAAFLAYSPQPTTLQ